MVADVLLVVVVTAGFGGGGGAPRFEAELPYKLFAEAILPFTRARKGKF